VSYIHIYECGTKADSAGRELAGEYEKIKEIRITKKAEQRRTKRNRM